MTTRRVVPFLRLCALGALAVVALTGCPPTPPPGGPPPPPTLVSLEIPTSTFGNGFTGVTPALPATGTTPARYFVLPLQTTTAPIVRVLLTSPYPAELSVTATDGSGTGQAVALPQLPAGSPMPATGAFQVATLTASNPARWLIVVRYPDAFQGSRQITTAISDVVGGIASTPLAFSMNFRGSTVSVSVASESSDGRITSNPAGIDCPGTCTADFLSSTSVVLTQSVLHNQTEFTGWTGACSGSASACTVALLAPGAAIVPVNPSVTAHFRVHTNTPVPPLAPACATPPVLPGKRWVAQPNCGLAARDGATPACDAQGWYCCGASGGNASARCAGHQETPVTCQTDPLGGGPVNQSLIQPGGCYESLP